DAAGPPNKFSLPAEIQPPGVARVVALDNVGQREHLPSTLTIKRHGYQRVAVDTADLFAGCQVVERGGPSLRRDTKRQPVAGATPVEPEDQARTLLVASVVSREDAEAASIADERCAADFLVSESRPPHQRPIAEHPQVMTVVAAHVVRHDQSVMIASRPREWRALPGGGRSPAPEYPVRPG